MEFITISSNRPLSLWLSSIPSAFLGKKNSLRNKTDRSMPKYWASMLKCIKSVWLILNNFAQKLPALKVRKKWLCFNSSTWLRKVSPWRKFFSGKINCHKWLNTRIKPDMNLFSKNLIKRDHFQRKVQTFQQGLWLQEYLKEELISKKKSHQLSTTSILLSLCQPVNKISNKLLPKSFPKKKQR